MTAKEREYWLRLHERVIEIYQQAFNHAAADDDDQMRLYASALNDAHGECVNFLTETGATDDVCARYEEAIEKFTDTRFESFGSPEAVFDRIRTIAREFLDAEDAPPLG